MNKLCVSNANIENNKVKESVISSVAVENVKYDDEKGGIRFTLIVNNVSIYGCRWIEGSKNGKDYAFVTFPSYKSGNKFYNNAWVSLNEEDTEKINALLSDALGSIAD